MGCVGVCGSGVVVLCVLVETKGYLQKDALYHTNKQSNLYKLEKSYKCLSCGWISS